MTKKEMTDPKIARPREFWIFLNTSNYTEVGGTVYLGEQEQQPFPVISKSAFEELLKAAREFRATFRLNSEANLAINDLCSAAKKFDSVLKNLGVTND